MSSPTSTPRPLARLAMAGAPIALAMLLGAGCGGSRQQAPRTESRAQGAATARSAGATAPPAASSSTSSVPTAAPPPPPPRLAVRAPASVGPGWGTVARVHGRPAAWLARRAGVSLMRFDQSLVHLTLHTGTSDGGESGWAYPNRVTRREIHSLIATFNGGFKLSYHDVGFVSARRVAAPLSPGLASIVTYTDGSTDIGAWRAGVPRPGGHVFSVLQNQRLLVDHGAGAANLSSCIIACWGETIGSRTVVARSGLGVRADGQLVWAAGEQLTPGGLAHALLAAGAQRAIELDINPDWVAGYLYPHHPTGPTAVPVVPEQHGIAGAMLEADPRDFLAVIAN